MGDSWGPWPWSTTTFLDAHCGEAKAQCPAHPTASHLLALSWGEGRPQHGRVARLHLHSHCAPLPFLLDSLAKQRIKVEHKTRQKTGDVSYPEAEKGT